MCFDPSAVQDATHPAGYLGRCWKAKTYDPSSATPVKVTAGATTAAITAALPAGGGISGTVTTAGADSLSYLGYDLQGPNLSEGGSMEVVNGAYVIGQLPAGSYTICFQTEDSDLPYAPACYSTAADGSASSVTVTAGKVTSGINAVLPVGGAIAGTVTDTSDTPLADIDVDVSGGPTGDTVEYTNAEGQYDATGLAPGSYTVCFSEDFDSSSPTGHVPECYNQTTQSTATPVTVTGGATTSGIDAVLTPGGGISGTVLDGDSSPVTTAEVDASVAGGDGETAAYAYTDDSGTYSLSGLPAGSYDVCFYDYSGTYASQCYDDVTDGSTPTSVAVTAGSVTSGIDATLAPYEDLARRPS